tara:strand:+ start:284 stop:1009 length:726 start_codon:yes stop_codon:yes gene_type:complete
MRKLIAEGFVIFTSIIASFSVENYRESNEEKEILNDAVITLGDEIDSNILYTKEHLKQVRNMLYVTKETVDNFDNINLDEIFRIHSNNPYMHSIIENGEIEYIKKYQESYMIFVWSNAWEPENIFFKSMLNSGKLLEIKNKKLRREIESIYTKQEERVSGMAKLTGDVSANLILWFDNKQDSFNKDITITKVFNDHKNQKLKNILSRRKTNLEYRVKDIENYLQALQNVVLLISTEYKKLD